MRRRFARKWKAMQIPATSKWNTTAHTMIFTIVPSSCDEKYWMFLSSLTYFPGFSLGFIVRNPSLVTPSFCTWVTTFITRP